MKIKEKTFCVMGFTNAGKDSLCKRISEEMNIPILVSHTTRPPRSQQEIDEKAYYFVDETFFEDESKFIETRKYNTVFGVWKYGLTHEEYIKNPISLFIVDRQGYEELSQVVGETNIVSIFIAVDDATLRERQVQRGDDINEFERRLKDDKLRFKGFMHDYSVSNYNINEAVEKIKSIIEEELGE
ncbi:MAG: hypothetical protein ACRDDY_17035 [Clostridium sp.]|uniref:hypothetical protein n=1 Tax=Clostridium sp. TaxID=1506 RepID=UPI003EE5E790